MDKEKLQRTIKNCYIYGYPIVGMYELLSEQVLNADSRQSELNQFHHTAELASPETSFIPAPNNDTTYSRAWLDLRSGPVYITVPDTDDRFYSIQFLDLYSETIRNVGKRTTGTRESVFVVTGPGVTETFPDHVIQIKSNTVFVLAFLRTLVENEADLENVKRLQRSIIITGTSNNFSQNMLPVYKNDTPQEFFHTLKNVLDLSPILPEEKSLYVDIIAVSAASDSLLIEATGQAAAEIDRGGLEFGESVNYWRVAGKGIGNYGTDYFQRAVVWHKGALANQPEESLYPSTFQDSTGERLDGNFCYQITFEPGSFPPVSQFWSITLYIFENAFLYANEISRYSIGDRTPGLYKEADGSLTVYIQNRKPDDPSKSANWLPAPAQPFYLTMRLYGPSQDAVSGEWKPPMVIKDNDSN